jgi:hypothetical protein
MKDTGRAMLQEEKKDQNQKRRRSLVAVLAHGMCLYCFR